LGKIKYFFIIVVPFLLMIHGGCVSAPSKSSITMPSGYDKIIAVGDIHGSIAGLKSILKQTALIDDADRWIGGNTLLVQTGDLLDRGADVRQVMDLLMSLQSQAVTKGGKVVVLLGNHEVMNIIGARQYVNPAAYKSFIESDSPDKQEKAFEKWRAIFGVSYGSVGDDPDIMKQKWITEHPQGFVEYTEAMGPEGKYGRWLRTLPAMYRYGGSIFMHAGISPTYAGLSLTSLNQNIDEQIKKFDMFKQELMKAKLVEQFFSLSEMNSVVDGIITASETQKLPQGMLDAITRLKEIRTYLASIFDVSPLMADAGPLWFRGFAEWPDEQLTSYIPAWLAKNKALRMVTAHTPRSSGKIQERLAGEIFLIDTGMNSEFFKGGEASALEIKDDDVSAVYQTGDRFSFPPPGINYGPEHVWTDHEGSPVKFKSADEIEHFLMIASPVSTDIIKAGITKPLKVLLEKDGYRLNAVFRYYTETDGPGPRPGEESKIRYFRDSSQSEIAAYEINIILGLDNIPPTVFRTLNGMKGTMQLWAEQTMSDQDRANKKLLPPEALLWNRQMWDMQVFDNLINNIDRNQTNILIDDRWRMILIDHTRSFARDNSLPDPENVSHCSRGLWHALRHLDETETRKRLSPYLNALEMDALFIRQKALIKLIKDLINRNGEENVLD
jgi:hypothetical protein